MLIPVQLSQGVQLPKANGAICDCHENGLLAGMQGNALHWGSHLGKHVQKLKLATLT